MIRFMNRFMNRFVIRVSGQAVRCWVGDRHEKKLARFYSRLLP
jgi:hypothetical protein